jgi:hypothetical protein
MQSPCRAEIRRSAASFRRRASETGHRAVPSDETGHKWHRRVRRNWLSPRATGGPSLGPDHWSPHERHRDRHRMNLTRKLPTLAALFATAAIAHAATQPNLEGPMTPERDIRPSGTSSERDFDFLAGQWRVHNRKLKLRLQQSGDWSEFESTLYMRKALNGYGNVESYYATFDGKPFEGMAVRLFDPSTRLWTIYWIDSNGRTMDQHPVSGSFEDRLGKFYARDTFNGTPIVVLYQWDARDPQHPKWSQAFSTDEGRSWEWNWVMTLTRAD